ncbi:TPA: type-F conjugative transfer system mating-pair stabilization protein TraN [Vibrio vulnificus]|nr:type-F conjugative transfer system mating-pair stabilization protein TraN [Vibrio vulnificus]
MRLYFWTALALSLFCTLAFADDQQTFTDSANWAKQTASQALTPNALPFNIDEYCADATCRRDIRAPKEANLSDSDINAQKGAAFASDEIAQSINANFNQGRPDIKNDPAMQFALLGQENAFEVTHGLSNAYVDCQKGTQCTIEHRPRQCNQPTNNAVPCDKLPVFKPETTPVSYQCKSGWTLNGTLCKKPSVECRYDNNNKILERGGYCGGGQYSYTWWDRLRPNFPYWKGKRTFDHETSCRRGEHSGWEQHWEICRAIELSEPATPTCSSGNTLAGHTCVKQVPSWQSQCSLINSCKAISETCIDGPQTRLINGIPTYLDCWKYRTTYHCELSDSCATLPKDCQEQSRTCSLKQNGVCVEDEVKKACPHKQCSTTQLSCGEQSFCLDGDCYTEEPKLNGNFDKSVAALAGLSEAVKDIGDPPQIFTGKPMKCDKKLAGFNDCCKDSGWGQNLGAKCSEAEEALGKAKEKGLTLYVGEYCASKVLGVCTRKKRSYCVYDSKLAKIIQEQGSVGQLGKGLGSAKSPTCAAITPEELGQINFEYIDFKEFYPEMHANAQLPNFDEIKKRLQSATGN